MTNRKEPTWLRNDADDGDKPVCPYCNKPYPDAAVFDIKNYPEDGTLALFFPCERCDGKEAKIAVSWETIKKGVIR